MFRFAVLFGVGMMFFTPAHAEEYRAQNGVIVTTVPGGFSISSGGGYGARGIWCAAADFAQNQLGAGLIDRLYITQPRSSRRGPVVFSREQAAAGGQQVLITGFSLRQAGANLSVGHAIGFCADAHETDR